VAKIFQNPDDLLHDYFKSHHETSPSDDALLLLKGFIEGGLRWRDDKVVDFAKSVMTRANFDVCDLAENFLGIDVYITDLSSYDERADAPVFGIARPASQTIEICQRAEKYEPLFRSTVMHEVAHIVKHSRGRKGAMHYAPAAKHRPQEEMEADRFMADALLPLPILFLSVFALAQQMALNPIEAFACADSSRGQFQWKNFYFTPLINQLCVSRELIAISLRHYRFISERTLEYHRSYSLSTKWRKAAPGFNFRHAAMQVARTFGLNQARRAKC